MTETHTVQEEAGQRLDKLMTNLVPDISRQNIQKWIKRGVITVDGNVKKPNHLCTVGEIITWSIPQEQKKEIMAENIPLDIMYEDEFLLIINKPKGMLVHPTSQVQQGTLVNALLYHCAELSDISGEDRPGIVHRLDRDTSGLLIVAKTNTIHEQLKVQFQERNVKRIYEAIVYGVVQHEQGIIDAPIGRNPKNRLQMAVVDSGKQAETHFRVLHHFKQYTHLECELITGRTHQIRVHMKYMNHPIVGDDLYVRKNTNLIKGQALFAKELSFVHPATGQTMTFTVETPSDFQTLLNKLTAE